MAELRDIQECTHEHFTKILTKILKEELETPTNLLAIRGAWEVFSEHYNNEVLTRFENLPRRFNHVFTLSFTVESTTASGKGVTMEDLREGLRTRMESLDFGGEADWLEACGAPDDTFEVDIESIITKGE